MPWKPLALKGTQERNPGPKRMERRSRWLGGLWPFHHAYYGFIGFGLFISFFGLASDFRPGISAAFVFPLSLKMHEVRDMATSSWCSADWFAASVFVHCISRIPMTCHLTTSPPTAAVSRWQGRFSLPRTRCYFIQMRFLNFIWVRLDPGWFVLHAR